MSSITPDTPCIHCGKPIMFGQKSQAWLSFVWVGVELTALCGDSPSGYHAASQ